MQPSHPPADLDPRELARFDASYSQGAPTECWEWRAGDTVLWPNGVEGKVCGVDFDDMLLLDDCGAWHSMYDVDRVPA